MISVIIPVYNAEKWLRRCVDSILAQTFTDFELLLIDDGSKDGSGAICDEYVAKDKRVRVFHKPNGGVSSARNVGLDNARGEWVTFVDSDDWVDNTYLEHLISQSDADLRMSLFWIEYPDRISEMCYAKCSFDDSMSVQNTLNVASTYLWNICCKLYRLSLLRRNSIGFERNLSMGEDTFFNYRYLASCKTASICRYADYHYMQDNIDSLSRRNNSIENIRAFHSLICPTLEKFPKQVDTSGIELLLSSFLLGQFMANKPSPKELKEFVKDPVLHRLVNSSVGKGKKRLIFDRLIKVGLYKLAIAYSKRIGGAY